MRVAIGLFLALLGLPSTHVSAGTRITGEVVRAPAAARAPVSVSRYRERTTRPAEAADTVELAACGCRPAEFAVVHLSGENLPEPVMPLQPPVMAQKDRAFVPAVLAIPVGGSVDFPNMDPFFHNVFSYSKTRKFDLGRYPKGEVQSVRFEAPGIVPVFCEIHYSMRAYIHVLETPYFAVSDESRRFEIPDVAPGDYELHVWQEGLPELSISVSVGQEPLHLVVP